MSETKIVVNKHFKDPTKITSDVFAVGGSAKGGYFAEGEIVICSDVNNPSLYLMTGVTGLTHHGNVINVTSGEFIRLSSAYTESQGEGPALIVHTGDTIDVAVGKIVKRVNDTHNGAIQSISIDGTELDGDTGSTQTVTATKDDSTHDVKIDFSEFVFDCGTY